jgi:hypothetical protein
MATARRNFVLSAQAVDPLSWFIGPLVPLSFSILTLVYGTIQSALTWSAGPLPLLQPIAVVISAGAGLVVHFTTRPMRSGLGPGLAVVALCGSVAGMVISAIGYANSAFSLEQWWATAALALTIGSLAPYLPARRLLVLGTAATVIATVVTFFIVYPAHPGFGPFGTALLIAYPPVLATAATTVFSYSIVSTMLPMLESPSRIRVVGQTARDELSKQMERVTVARLTARAAPFLQDIAEARRISPADRALAGQLARRMRDELVTRSNLSWLASIASESRLVVVDPDHRARAMNHAQRTALRAMLRAILDTPGTDRGSLMVELRAAPDGATAVGVSLDIALPEGLRIMHLAPYYLTLGTAVDDLTIHSEEHLRMSFRVPADGATPTGR